MINPFFMFATGIENSIPTIQNGRARVDELEKCGFYKNWQTDFNLLQELGIHFLRYGPPLHKTFLGPGRYDWEFSDLTFNYLKPDSPPRGRTSATSMTVRGLERPTIPAIGRRDGGLARRRSP